MKRRKFQPAEDILVEFGKVGEVDMGVKGNYTISFANSSEFCIVVADVRYLYIGEE